MTPRPGKGDRRAPTGRCSAAGSLLLLFFAIVCFGCVGIDDLSRESYRRGVLYTHNLSQETIAVLPMKGSGNNRDYLPSAESIFFKALTEMRETNQFISPKDALDRIKENDLNAFFEKFQDQASFKRVAEEKALGEFKKVFGTRFLLQTELERVETTEGATQVLIRGRLWDIEMGDIVWEGTGESRGYLFLFFPRVPASFEKAVEVASRGLIKRLP